MVCLIVGFVTGVFVLQQQPVLPDVSLLFPAILIAGILHGLIRNHFSSNLIKLSTLLLIGSLSGFFYAANFANIRMHDALPLHWQQKNIEVIGVVASMPELKDKGVSFQFNVEQVMTPDAIVPSHIRLSSYDASHWHSSLTRLGKPRNAHLFGVGQRWRMTVRLKRPHTTYNPHGYDFEAWAFANNVRAVGNVRKKQGLTKLSNFVWRPSYMVEYCRNVVAKRIEHALSNTPYGGVIRALVVGDGNQIKPADWQTYLNTGTNHLMSISGLHITMLAGLAFSLTAAIWSRVPWLVSHLATRKAATLSGILIASLYACLAGLSVPTQRTLYMLLVFGLALFTNKQINILRVLPLAMFVVVMFDPWAVIAPGFWLSFSAVAVIAYASLYRLRLQHWLVEATKTQWVVTLGLLPFLLAMFGQASIVSPLANAIAIPVISLLVVPLAILGALLPIDTPLLLAQLLLEWTMLGLNWLANISFANWYQAFPPVWSLLLGLFGVLWALLPRGWSLRWLGFVLLLPMLLYEPSKLAKGQMRLSILDVGQGLAVVVKTANHIMVYDTGQYYNPSSDVGSRILLPYLRAHGISSLSGLVISHDDIDHNGGAASLIESMPVDWVFSSYKLPAKMQSGVHHQLCKAGQSWTWDAVRFEVLYPNKDTYQDKALSDNNRSCVIKVNSRYGSVLLTGDIEKEVESLLVKQAKQSIISDLLIAPHHGSLTSSTNPFIRLNGAKHVVFTVGYLNRFQHPRPEVLSRYLQNRANLYRTDTDGALVVDFNEKNKLKVTRWRQEEPKYWH